MDAHAIVFHNVHFPLIEAGAFPFVGSFIISPLQAVVSAVQTAVGALFTILAALLSLLSKPFSTSASSYFENGVAESVDLTTRGFGLLLFSIGNVLSFGFLARTVVNDSENSGGQKKYFGYQK